MARIGRRNLNVRYANGPVLRPARFHKHNLRGPIR